MKAEEKELTKPIDNVTTENLNLALRMVGIDLNTEIIDRIIDLVELIEDKGYNTTMMDVIGLKAKWSGQN